MKKIPFISPGYFHNGRWVFTGCSLHDLDPCSECDTQ